MAEKAASTYDESQIQILEGLDPVRKRPGMYIGSTDKRGLHHLVYEIVDNSIDEAMAGFCDQIEITLTKEGSARIKDNGRGIPTGINKQTGKSTLEVAISMLHAGGKFGGGGYKVSGGLHGVGVSVVNALSTRLIATIERDGKIVTQEYKRGIPQTNVTEIGKSEKTGTTIEFFPDPEIFESVEFDYDTLRVRFREMAFLNRGVRIILTDERKDPVVRHEYHYEGGIVSFVEYLNQGKTTLLEHPIYMYGEKDMDIVEVALQYNDRYDSTIFSFANNINTVEGGTHETGLRSALTKAINDYARKYNLLKEKDENLTGDDVREGLVAVISVKLPEPQFEGQTKTKLGNSSMRTLTDNMVGNKLSEYLEENPKEAKKIVEKCILARAARDAARKARDVTRKKSGLFSMPVKLADCTSKNVSEREIFIVEGDSAGGSAKSGRNRKTQAILPLRGKILNVEKTRYDKALGNAEIRAMITAFGTGVGSEFDISKLRYDKIIIMTDADVDGSHIRILLLTFFYRYLRPIIEQGHVYAALPPLYRLSKGNQIFYAYSEEERVKFLEENGSGYEIQRYKGLGEMDASQLKETTMDPQKRTLMQVTLENAMEADELFDILMGENVEPRRAFIEENSKMVDKDSLDI
ncbi:MAG: DNA topoisomerase (ATP-hydrolyzing) subunit B [Clostridiales bacterium]|nr:MAG: DNA topoisomerase (ATP-hydrolyzing) subunit B [Clostridiales bacterium]